ncbi:MAG: hypothetical protein HQK53_10215, partial [Oligoflexia bacterium]|nr:hypothetical protein [Oligoflexia bacterium]
FSKNNHYDYRPYNSIGYGGYFWANEEIPHIKTLLYLLSALSLGANLLLLARNERAYNRYLRLSPLFSKYDSGGELFKVYYPTPAAWEKVQIEAVSDPATKFILVDGTISELRQLLQGPTPPKILSKYDAPGVENFAEYFQEFLLVRSIYAN